MFTEFIQQVVVKSIEVGEEDAVHYGIKAEKDNFPDPGILVGAIDGMKGIDKADE